MIKGEGFISTQPLLSVVMAIHRLVDSENSFEKTIKACINNGCEVILVLDASDRETEKIVLQMISKFANFLGQIIRVNYHNPGESRNAGLQLATGTWVTFWDCDDVGDSEVIIKLLAGISNDIEILIGSAEISNSKSSRIIERLNPNIELLTLNPGLWRFVFRRDITKSILFPALSSGEDQVFLARIRFLERKLQCADVVFYRYITGQNGQLTGSSVKIVDALHAARLVHEATFLSSQWRTGYSTIASRLLWTYALRSSDPVLVRGRNVMSFIRNSRDILFPLLLFKVLVQIITKTRK